MGIRSIFLITDSLYNCDCGWSAVPKKHACALSFRSFRRPEAVDSCPKEIQRFVFSVSRGSLIAIGKMNAKWDLWVISV